MSITIRLNAAHKNSPSPIVFEIADFRRAKTAANTTAKTNPGHPNIACLPPRQSDDSIDFMYRFCITSNPHTIRRLLAIEAAFGFHKPICLPHVGGDTNCDQ